MIIDPLKYISQALGVATVKPQRFYGSTSATVLVLALVYCAVFARAKFVRWRLACDQQKNPLFVLLSTLNV